MMKIYSLKDFEGPTKIQEREALTCNFNQETSERFHRSREGAILKVALKSEIMQAKPWSAMNWRKIWENGFNEEHDSIDHWPIDIVEYNQSWSGVSLHIFIRWWKEGNNFLMGFCLGFPQILQVYWIPAMKMEPL